MPDSHNNKTDLTSAQIEVFRMLYPLFKDEVFRRREHMIRLSTFHNGLLVLLLVIVPTVSSDATIDFGTRWLILSGLAVFSGFHAYLIFQQADRHRQAKRQLIELETMMGLYQKGWHCMGKTVYPEKWQTDWKLDRSIPIYLAALASLTALVTWAMLIHP
jgi:hypothetical protein